MPIKVVNPRRMKSEVWTVRKCKCGKEYSGRYFEDLCQQCAHQKMLTKIRNEQAEDDWHHMHGGGRMRRTHLGSN